MCERPRRKLEATALSLPEFSGFSWEQEEGAQHSEDRLSNQGETPKGLSRS